MSINPTVIRRIAKETLKLRQAPPEGIRVEVDEEDLGRVLGWVEGPAGTPYASGYFKVAFHFGPEFPAAPPKCTMITKIFHPNVSKTGEICVNTLKKDWKPEFGIEHILVTIKCLLIYPGPDSALDEEAGKLLQENYDDYFRHARLITDVHARTVPAPFLSSPTTTSTSPSSSSSAAAPTSATAAPAAARSSPNALTPSNGNGSAAGTGAGVGVGAKRAAGAEAGKKDAKAKKGLKRL